MAELTLFRHDPRPSFLFNLDPRVKTAVLAFSGAVVFLLEGAGLAAFGVAALLLFPLGRVSLRAAAGGAYLLWPVPVMLFLARLFGTPGEPLFSFLGLTATLGGLGAGAEEAARILVLVLLGHVYAASTSMSDLQRAVAWFLRPLPGNAGESLALFIGVTAGLVPRLLDDAGETLDAMRLRGFPFRRRPVEGLLMFGRAFFRKALREGAATAEALETRGFSYERSRKPFRPSRADALALAASLILLSTLLFFP